MPVDTKDVFAKIDQHQPREQSLRLRALYESADSIRKGKSANVGLIGGIIQSSLMQTVLFCGLILNDKNISSTVSLVLGILVVLSLIIQIYFLFFDCYIYADITMNRDKKKLQNMVKQLPSPKQDLEKLVEFDSEIKTTLREVVPEFPLL